MLVDFSYHENKPRASRLLAHQVPPIPKWDDEFKASFDKLGSIDGDDDLESCLNEISVSSQISNVAFAKDDVLLSHVHSYRSANICMLILDLKIRVKDSSSIDTGDWMLLCQAIHEDALRPRFRIS
jgi:hypothetical protein